MTGLNFANTKILIGPSLSIFWVVKYSMRYCFVFYFISRLKVIVKGTFITNIAL